MSKSILLATRLCNIATDGRVSTVYTTTFVHDGQDSSLLNSNYQGYQAAHDLVSKGYFNHLNDIDLSADPIDEPLTFESITEVVTCARIRKCSEVWMYSNLKHEWFLIDTLAVEGD